MKTIPLLAALLLAVTPLFACDDGGDDPGDGAGGGASPTSSHLEGTFTGGTGESGLLSLHVTAGASSGGLLREVVNGTVAGTLTIGGVETALTGTFAAPALTISGGGYSFSGTVTASGIAGSYTGPNGAGTFAVQDTAAGAVQVYCGTYAGDASGTWNLVERADGALSGSANPGAGLLEGTRTGDSIELTFDGGTASGTIAGTTATGTWSLSSGGGGTWTGTVGGC